MAVEYNITAFAAGQDHSLAWTMTPTTDIAGWTFKLSVRERWETVVLFTLTAGDGLTVVSAVAGTMTVFFSNAKTENLTPGCYVYDLWRIDVGNERRLTYGALTLVPRVSEIP